MFDQGVKDIMYEIAESRMTSQRQAQSSAGANAGSQRNRITSSEPPIPSSDRIEPEDSTPRADQDSDELDLMAEVQARNYKVRPFGLDATINMRDLDPKGMSKGRPQLFDANSVRCR